MFDLALEALKSLSGVLFGFLVAFFVGWWQLKKGHFWGRVTFTHIGLTPSKHLVLDTVLDKRAIDVWIDNSVLRNRIRKAAEQCTVSEPFVVLQDKEDEHKIYTGIRNQLSSHFSRGVVYNAFGREVDECFLYFVLCSLDSPTDKSKKLHVIVFTDEFMERFNKDKDEIWSNNKKRCELIRIIQKLNQQPYRIYRVRVYLPQDSLKFYNFRSF